MDDEFVDVPVYSGSAISPEDQYSGPAIVEEETTTVIVPSGYSFFCDTFGNYLVHTNCKSADEVVAMLKETPFNG